MHWAMQSPGLPVFGGKPEEKNPKRAVTHCPEMHKFALQIYFLKILSWECTQLPQTSYRSDLSSESIFGSALLTIEPRTQDHLWKSLPKGWSSHSPGCAHWRLKQALICTSKRPVTNQPCTQFTKWKTLVFRCQVQLFITRLLSMNW